MGYRRTVAESKAEGHRRPAREPAKRLWAGQEGSRFLWTGLQQLAGNQAVQRLLAQRNAPGGGTAFQLPSPAELARQIVIMERLRAVVERYLPITEVGPALRDELGSFMADQEIDRLELPIRTADEFEGQIYRLNIQVSYGPETQGERLEQILTGPRPEPAPPPALPSALPEWLSLYSQGRVGFHVSLPAVPGSPLIADLAAPFRERGLEVSSELLQELVANYEAGTEELEAVLAAVLPQELAGQIPALARLIADQLMSASLSATLRTAYPTRVEEAEEEGELIQEILSTGETEAEVGPLQQLIGSLGAGVSLTLRF
jgi:hypothetical protein